MNRTRFLKDSLAPVCWVLQSRPAPGRRLLRRASFRRRVEEDEERSAGREPSLGEASRPLGLTVEEANADREDLVEAPISQVEVLKGRDEELGLAGLDVRHVPAQIGRAHV